MPNETTTQRKRRLAKRKQKRIQKLANETIEEREKRLLKKRIYRQKQKKHIQLENSLNTVQKYGLDSMSLLKVRSEVFHKELHTFCDHKFEMTSYKTCSVPMCGSTTVKYPDKLFIHVPKSIKRRKQWLQLARRDPKLTSDKSAIFFCQDHFDLPNDMENYIQYSLMGSVGKIRMKPDCFPSKFECQHDTSSSVIIQEIVSKDAEMPVASGMTTNRDLHFDTEMESNFQDQATQVCPEATNKLIQQPKMESTSFPTASEIAELQTDTIIKEETDIDQGISEDIPLDIKSENLDDIGTQENNDDPFSNVQLEVKQEIPVEIEKDSIEQNEEYSMLKIDFDHESKPELEHYVTVPKSEMDCDDISKSEVKEETVLGDESIVTYDYPDFDDDVGSIDSTEAAALNQVEACLQDDINMKCEEDDDEHHHKEEYSKMDIKEESELTVTETHLISNKVINTTSTITNPHDGLIESKTTKTLVMEILPMTQTNMVFSKIGNPEEILPTTYDNGDDYMDYQDSFQLNSITGNVLSLEQEAYGLLKAKGKKKEVGETLHTCPKCPKTYRQKNYMKRHLAVHETIEKRAQGHIRSQITKRENKNKKLKAELERQAVKKEEKIKKEGYECTCGQSFQRRSRMETCLRSHNLFCETNTYPCVSCNKQFKDKEELALHRKRLHRKRFPCKFCPTDYHTRKELFKHLQVHQKVQLMEYKVISEVVKGKQKLKCFMCPKSYMELSDLKCHVMDDHKEPYSCPRCKRTFSKIIDFGNHTKTSHPEVEGQSVLDVLEAFSKLVKAWKCEECGLQFHEADKLAMHQIEKHSPDLKAEMQFQCTDCRRVFVSQKGLTSHRRIHHSTESVEEPEPVEQGVMCLECRKMCKDMNALLSHMRYHSPDRKYPCKFCDFRFATPEKRKAHADIHTGDMKYVCFICEYQCSSENRLRTHKLSPKHVNMKEFLLTGKPLVQEAQSSAKQEKIKETLKKKEWQVKEKKKKEKTRSASPECSEVACDICGDKFPSESEMLEHKLTHPFIEFPNEDTPSRIFFK